MAARLNVLLGIVRVGFDCGGMLRSADLVVWVGYVSGPSERSSLFRGRDANGQNRLQPGWDAAVTRKCLSTRYTQGTFRGALGRYSAQPDRRPVAAVGFTLHSRVVVSNRGETTGERHHGEPADCMVSCERLCMQVALVRLQPPGRAVCIL